MRTGALERPQFARAIGDAERLLEDIADLARLVEPEEEITVCRDPKDNRFLEAAVAGDADVIVIGDKDLLVLHPFRGIEIVTLAAFVERLDALAPAPQPPDEIDCRAWQQFSREHGPPGMRCTPARTASASPTPAAPQATSISEGA